MTTITRAAEPAAIVVELTAEEANAVLFTVALETTCEGEKLAHRDISTSPGDLFRISNNARRIARLVTIGDQLKWRAHWGPNGGEPPAVIATEAVWLALSAALLERVGQWDDDPDVKDFPFDRAARTIARAFAGSEA